MRMIRVWISCFIFMFVVTASWWLTLPMVISIADTLKPMTLIPEASLLIDTVSYIATLWGPLLDFFILIWAFMESQRRDVESEIYS